MHNQTINYQMESKILYIYQSGFYKNHSTDTTDEVLIDFDSGLLTGMVLMDLQKAFDIINYEILLEKISLLGFSNHSIKWLIIQ